MLSTLFMYKHAGSTNSSDSKTSIASNSLFKVFLVCTAASRPFTIVANLKLFNWSLIYWRLLYQYIISEDALAGLVFKSLNSLSVSFINFLEYSKCSRILLRELSFLSWWLSRYISALRFKSFKSTSLSFIYASKSINSWDLSAYST